jgi:hypothetical protein
VGQEAIQMPPSRCRAGSWDGRGRGCRLGRVGFGVHRGLTFQMREAGMVGAIPASLLPGLNGGSSVNWPPVPPVGAVPDCRAGNQADRQVRTLKLVRMPLA